MRSYGTRTLLIILILSSAMAGAHTLCFGHRGGGRAYFDNSISAFKAAIENKIDGIEIDLHQTKDGQAILLHDDDLKEVGVGQNCALETSVTNLSFSSIRSNCKLKNGEDIPTLNEFFDLVKDSSAQIILDLKVSLNDSSIKSILESGIGMNRIRLTAFSAEFLKSLETSSILSLEQLKVWNSIPRYENFRHPVLAATDFNKNLHLFSAFIYGKLGSPDTHFGAWEVNYPFLLNWILPFNPEFIVTKIPSDCMRLRDAHFQSPVAHKQVGYSFHLPRQFFSDFFKYLRF